MKQKIVKNQETKITADEASRYAETGKSVVGYHTGDGPALLACISNGGLRDPRSLKPRDELWGFLYLKGGRRDMTFVRSSPRECIEMALANGTQLYQYSSLKELLEG